MLHRFQLHLVGKGPLARQDIFSLQIGIHHQHRCRIIIHLPDKHRDFGKTCGQCRVRPPMAGDDLKGSILQRSCNQRCQHAVLSNTLGSP